MKTDVNRRANNEYISRGEEMGGQKSLSERGRIASARAEEEERVETTKNNWEEKRTNRSCTLKNKDCQI